MAKKLNGRRRGAAIVGAVSACVLASCVGGESGPQSELRAPTTVENTEGVGPWRKGTFTTPMGRSALWYRQVGDQRIFEGDIALPASEEELASVDRSTFLTGRDTATYRWPNHTIAWMIDPTPPAPPPNGFRTKVLGAVAMWQRNTSLRFVEVAPGGAADVVQFSYNTTGDCNSPVGRQGGLQTINISGGCNTIGHIAHEIGHSVGLFHEQTRGDRDQHITLLPQCVKSNQWHNFALNSGSAYGLYDFTSIMHYGSNAFAIPATDPNAATCTIPPIPPNEPLALWRASTQGALPTDDDVLIQQRDDLSFLDRQGVEEMYNRGFGHAVATADFDGDGNVDVAVGAPRLGAGGTFGEGHVQVFRAAGGALTRTDDVASTSGGIDDRYGYTLGTGDLNGDGRADLIVGAPGAVVQRGQVTVYFGQAPGVGGSMLSAPITLSLPVAPPHPSEPYDRFGASITVGDFDGDGDGDLAVGAPGRRMLNAAGVPVTGAGAVYLYQWNAALGAFDLTSELDQVGLDNNEIGDGFGTSLTDADINNDGFRDLVVGAPYERNGAHASSGAVYVFRGSAAGMVTHTTLLPGTFEAPDMLFGFSVTKGDYNGDGLRDLAIGAPGAAVVPATPTIPPLPGTGRQWAGRVFVYTNSGGGTFASAGTLTAPVTVIGGAFGFSLASNQFNAGVLSDLAVGAPGAEPVVNVGSGRAYLFTGVAAPLPLALTQTIDQSGPIGNNSAGDRLGASVDFGDFDNDGLRDLYVGASGDRVAAQSNGSVFMLRSNGVALVHHTMLQP